MDGIRLPVTRGFLFTSRLCPDRWGEESLEDELDEDDVDDDVEEEELLLEDVKLLRYPCWPCVRLSSRFLLRAPNWPSFLCGSKTSLKSLP